MEIVLNRRLAQNYAKKLEFTEKDPDHALKEEPGFTEFLRDRSLSSDATDEQIDFLKRLRFNGKRPTALYCYRELQNLKDPLHFRGWPYGGSIVLGSGPPKADSRLEFADRSSNAPPDTGNSSVH
jgi:hypothetical protein